MDPHSPILLLATLFLITASCVRAENICQGKPADVFFILDSSGSISRPDFARQLNFVKGVVDILDVSSDMTRVGALSFSNWAFIDFHLRTFHTKDQVKAAIGRIRQIHGDTNTAAALAFLTDVAFSSYYGARPDIPRIAVVLTDGKSNKPWETAREAFKARLSGIHVFAIGIGDQVDLEELRRIASAPESKHVFHVSSYSALTSSMAELLAIETCKVTLKPTPAPATTTTTTTTPAPTPKRLACGDVDLVDIVFGGSPNSSPQNTVKTLEFFRDVSSTLDTANDHVRVGLAPKDCSAVPELTIRDFTDKDEVINQLDKMHTVRKSPASVMRYIRKTSFKTKNGARPEAKKIAVVIIDENDERSILHVMREAFLLQAMQNVELFVVAIGDGLSQEDLEAMAPDPGHVLRVDNYDQLAEKVALLRNLLCPEPST